MTHHLKIGETTWCDWTGCQAGQTLADKLGARISCDQPSAAAAKRAATQLRPHFRRGAVKVIAGACPHSPGARS